MPNLTAARPGKPAKPRPDWPLFPHATGRWAKKIRGRLHYFGPWADADGALQKYLDQKDDLYAGRKPRPKSDGLTVRDLVNHFLTAKRRKADAGEMTMRSWHEYHDTCDRVLSAFGRDRAVTDLASEDFGQFRATLADGRGPDSLGGHVRRTRSLFKYAYDAGLIDRPVRWGPEFVCPGRVALRKARQSKPPRLFTAPEIGRLLKAASAPMRAMILLGINCGFGNSDCATLPKSALDLANCMLDFPRPKTAVDRRAALWPETVKALRAVLATRPQPKEQAAAGLVFITRYGQPWVKYRDTGVINSVTLEFGKLLDDLGMHREGVNFYALRHTFETIAGETGDQPAVDRVMGHEQASMATAYREWTKDKRENERLRRIAEHVRQWLFGRKSQRKAAS